MSRLIFVDNINRISHLPIAIYTYCIFPYLDLSSLITVYKIDKQFRKESTPVILTLIRHLLKSLECTIDDAIWYANQLTTYSDRVTLTIAQSFFRVPDSELINIPHIRERNKRYPKSWPLKLYLLADILIACISKHKSAKALEAYNTKLLLRKSKKNAIKIIH